VRVPVTTDGHSSASDRYVAIRTGRIIRLLDARRLRARVVAKAGGDGPIGLSIKANRLAWAENSGDDYVRAIQPPG